MALILSEAFRITELQQTHVRSSFCMHAALMGDSSLRHRRYLFFDTSRVSSFDKPGPIVLCTNPVKYRSVANKKNEAESQARLNIKTPEVPPKKEKRSRPCTNLYTAKSPHTATIVSVEKISGKSAKETYHIVFDHDGFLPHWEGQVFGVMPPAENSFEPGDAKKLRYFSIACSRYGETPDTTTTASLCVRRKSGTDFLCKSKPGDQIQVTGPTREAMLLGDYGLNAAHIFVATGTGIAPFRSHLGRLFDDKSKFSGDVWLFHGVSSKEEKFYNEEFTKYEKKYGKHFKYIIAEQKKEYDHGEKKYVLETFTKQAGDVYDKLIKNKNAYIYIAGHKGMVSPIEKNLKEAAVKRGHNWEEKLADLKRNKQWRVEVY